MKKLLATILALVMALGLCSVAWAEGEENVASYDNTGYSSLQDAINEAVKHSGQQTVTLLKDVEITETISFVNVQAASVVLDLGGFTLAGKGCRAIQVNKGNLFLKNGIVTSTGIDAGSSVIRVGSDDATYTGANPKLYMENNAKVVAPCSYGVTIFGSATKGEYLQVSNSTIEATGAKPAISGNGSEKYNTDKSSGWKVMKIVIGERAVVSAANSYAIYHPDCGELSIQGGNISGLGGIQMCSGSLKISGSPVITATGAAALEKTENDGVVYDMAAISVVNRSYPGGVPTVTIKGMPTITAAAEVIHAYTWDGTTKAESTWNEAGTNINVSGGTYNKEFDKSFLAAGVTLTENNGSYGVETPKVAEFNGTRYETLSAALTAAGQVGGTVKLLKNVALDSSVGIGNAANAVTLNLDGKSIEFTNGAQLYVAGDATSVITGGGTIKRVDEPGAGNPDDFVVKINSGAGLELNGITVAGKYGIYNLGGRLQVTKANIETTGWSIAVNDSAAKTGTATIGTAGGNNADVVIASVNGNCVGTQVNSKCNVTINSGTLTSGGIGEYDGVVYWASQGKLTINGGKLGASTAEGSVAAAVYQKNGSVAVSAGTFTGNKSLVVKAGEGSTGTMQTELTGGTYSTNPEGYISDGYKSESNGNGTFTVKKASQYYYTAPSATTDAKTSPKTFDAGVGIYTATALLSIGGMAWVGKKRG